MWYGPVKKKFPYVIDAAIDIDSNLVIGIKKININIGTKITI